MSLRRNTTNRLNLHRQCHTCGRWIMTTADTPWMRQMYNVDGKRQKTCYFCSSSCFQASYKHIGWYDGKAEQRRQEKDARRDTREKNRRYYAAHREQELERARKYRAEHLEECREAVRYNHHKRKLREVTG